MKYIKYLVLLIPTLLLGNLIYVATQVGNYVVAGSLSVVFLLIAFLVINFKGGVHNFKFDLDDKNLSVNQKDNDEPKA